MIEQRRRTPGPGDGDVLSLLLRAREGTEVGLSDAELGRLLINEYVRFPAAAPAG